MMGMLFGLAVLVLVVAGLYLQRRQKKSWIDEERFEESGDWLDKRAGERGTYGSLDAEREQERKKITVQGRINELARLLRDYFFEHYPGFESLGDRQIKDFTNTARQQIGLFFDTIAALQNNQVPSQETVPKADAHADALKKIILDFSYQHFPELLDLEIERIKVFDQIALALAVDLLGEVELLLKET